MDREIFQEESIKNEVRNIIREVIYHDEDTRKEMRNIAREMFYHDEMLRSSIIEMIKESLEVNRENSQEATTIYKLNQQIEILMQEKSSLEQEMNNLKERTQSLESQIESLKQQENDTLTEQLEEVGEESNALIETTSSLERQLEEKNQKVMSLEQQLEEQQHKNQLLEEQHALLSVKYERLKQDKQSVVEEKNTIENELESYKNDFSLVRQSYERYQQLDSNIQDTLRTVIQPDTVMSYYTSGIRWQNIEALWEWLSYQLDTLEPNNKEILIQTLYDFFERYNAVNAEYELLETNTGESFDEDLHSRASRSNVAGTISEILLKGYQTKRTQKIIKKTIVRI